MIEVLQAICGFLVTICLGLVSWCLKAIVDLKTRVAMNEARDEMCRAEINRRFAELREEQNRLNRALVAEVKETNKYIRQMDTKISTMQEDLAVLKAQQHGG